MGKRHKYFTQFYIGMSTKIWKCADCHCIIGNMQIKTTMWYDCTLTRMDCMKNSKILNIGENMEWLEHLCIVVMGNHVTTINTLQQFLTKLSIFSDTLFFMEYVFPKKMNVYVHIFKTIYNICHHWGQTLEMT